MSITFGQGITVGQGIWMTSPTNPNFGEVVYDVAGTYSWTAPAGVTSVCVVCVGGGSGGICYLNSGITSWIQGFGGQGGSLAWKNNITVVPGNSYTVVVGAGGARFYDDYNARTYLRNPGGNSYFINTSTVFAQGGLPYAGYSGITQPTYVGDGGGKGGRIGNFQGDLTGGSGAGGYSGDGGDGNVGVDGNSGSGGGGGGGYGGGNGQGGGVGLYGEGASGAGSSKVYNIFNGRPGSGGTTKTYGGGGGGIGFFDTSTNNGIGGGGAVRILWGAGRAFPNTNVGIL